MYTGIRVGTLALYNIESRRPIVCVGLCRYRSSRYFSWAAPQLHAGMRMTMQWPLPPPSDHLPYEARTQLLQEP